MKKLALAAVIVGCALSMSRVFANAETPPAAAPVPPVAQTLVREGDFAVKLEFALGLGTTDDEAEAESRLAEVGIAPRNGWIADYPVTPDIVGELQQAVAAAADAGKIALARDEALKRFEGVTSDLGGPIRTYTGSPAPEEEPVVGEVSQPPTVINNYYTTEGPPVVTYYTPPPDYYYLYSWVPYPFWFSSFWFPGYFILNDFHRPFHRHNRVGFISNHFNDTRIHRVYRVDPVARFNGRTFGGIGGGHHRNILSTGTPHGERRIFNAPRSLTQPGMRPVRGMRSYVTPQRGSERTYLPAAPRSGDSRSFTSPSHRPAQSPRGSFSSPRSGSGGVSAPRSGSFSRPGGGGSRAPGGEARGMPGGRSGGGGGRGHR